VQAVDSAASFNSQYTRRYCRRLAQKYRPDAGEPLRRQDSLRRRVPLDTQDLSRIWTILDDLGCRRI
jgi:hypothetical protein